MLKESTCAECHSLIWFNPLDDDDPTEGEWQHSSLRYLGSMRWGPHDHKARPSEVASR